jgi:hypothetical protein
VVSFRLSKPEGATSKDHFQEASMNVRGDRAVTKRLTKVNTRSSKPKVPEVEWELADDQLDEALRQTFPASDALSIVQGARRS